MVVEIFHSAARRRSRGRIFSPRAAAFIGAQVGEDGAKTLAKALKDSRIAKLALDCVLPVLSALCVCVLSVVAFLVCVERRCPVDFFETF